MISRAKLMTIIVAGAALCAAAEAKETTLRVKDHGVYGAMRRMGCRADWLSVVLRESNFLESELNSLPEGTRIVVPDDCQNHSPARIDARISRRVLAHVAARRTSRDLQEANGVLHGQMEEKVTQLTVLTVKAKELQKQNEGLLVGVQNAERKAQLAESRVDVSLWLNIAIGGVVGAIMAFAGLWFFLIRRLGKHQEALVAERDRYQGELRDTEQKLQALHESRATLTPAASSELSSASAIQYHDEQIVFQLSETFYKCPFCSEKKITSRQNMYKHLDNAHPHLRVVEKPVDEIKRKLQMMA